MKSFLSKGGLLVAIVLVVLGFWGYNSWIKAAPPPPTEEVILVLAPEGECKTEVVALCDEKGPPLYEWRCSVHKNVVSITMLIFHEGSTGPGCFLAVVTWERNGRSGGQVFTTKSLNLPTGWYDAGTDEAEFVDPREVGYQILNACAKHYKAYFEKAPKLQ